MALAKEMDEAGIAVAGAPLQPPETATTLRTTGARTTMTDGPFAETKEVLGGFDLIDVADGDAALEWARKVPGNGLVEVRPVLDLSGMS